MSRWIANLIGAAVITIAVASLCQEMEKPAEERRWHGKIGFVPYEFRLPTIERLRATYWNTESHGIFMPSAFGIGWGINLFALTEKMRLISECYASEDDFLMPTPSLREVLEKRPSIF